MKCYENPTVTNWALRLLNAKLAERGGDRKPGDPFHASEIFQCFRKTILGRTRPPQAAFDRQTAIKFATGYALQEWWLGPELEGEEILGIVFSADRLVKGQVLEFKTTRMSIEALPKDPKTNKGIRGAPKVRFNPETNQYTKGWITRSLAYCVAHNVKKAHILVLFLYQNDFTTFTLEFDDHDIAEAKADIIARRDVLNDYIKTGTTPDVSTRLGDWECANCRFLADECLGALQAAGADVKEEE